MNYLQSQPRRQKQPYVAAAETVLWLLVALLVIVSGLWCGLAILHGSNLTHESGVMTTLAMDLHRGVFYRPLISDIGYGGTRYGPAFILLQGGLIGAGLSPVAAGHLLCLSAGLLLFLAMLGLVVPRRHGWAAALVFVLLLFVGRSTTALFTEIRCDFLATALATLGIFCIACAEPVRHQPENPKEVTKRWLLVCASCLFAFALLTKFTCGFAFAAAVVWLCLQRRWGGAILVATLTMVLTAGAALGANHLSDGRMWQNFHACASRAPAGLQGWLHQLREVIVVVDWPGTLLTLAALLAWVVAPVRSKMSLLGILLILTVALTIPMFASPGIGLNHVLDAQVAAVLFLAVAWDDLPLKPAWSILLVLIVLCALARFSTKKHLALALYRKEAAFRHAVAVAHPGQGPIFSDNAMIPVSVGQPSFLLDDFTFPTVRRVDPPAQQDLYDRLDRQFFGAVILRYDPTTGDRPFVFGDAFTRHLFAHYQLVGRSDYWDHLWIYSPKPKS